MKWIVALVGLMLAFAGGLAIWDGLNIIQVERGWVGVIGGSVALVGGLILMAMSLVVSRLESILDLLAEPPQALPLQHDRLVREEAAGETAPRNLRSAFYQDADATAGREVPPPPREVPVEPLPLAHPAEKDDGGSSGFERWAPRETPRKEFRFAFPPVPARPARTEPGPEPETDQYARAASEEPGDSPPTGPVSQSAADEAVALHAEFARENTAQAAAAVAAAERPAVQEVVAQFTQEASYEPPARPASEPAPFEIASSRGHGLRDVDPRQAEPAAEAPMVAELGAESGTLGHVASEQQANAQPMQSSEDARHMAGAEPAVEEPADAAQARDVADVPAFYRSDADDDQIYVAELRGSFTDSVETEPVTYEPAAAAEQEEAVAAPEEPESEAPRPQEAVEEAPAARRKAGLFPLRWKTDAAAPETLSSEPAPPAGGEEPAMAEAVAPPPEPPARESRAAPTPSGSPRRPAVENTDWLERALSGVDEPPPPRNFASRLGGKPDQSPQRSASGDGFNGGPQATRDPIMAPREPIMAHREPADYRQPEPPRAPEPEAPASLPALAEPSVVGRYEAQGTSYVMYSDGSIDAETETGSFRFASLAELKKFIERRA